MTEAVAVVKLGQVGVTVIRGLALTPTPSATP